MEDKEFNLECNGHDGLLKIIQYKEKDYQNIYFLEYFAGLFGERQNGVFSIIWRRIKFAFSMLRGKEFFLYELVLTEEEFQKLKNFIDSL